MLEVTPEAFDGIHLPGAGRQTLEKKWKRCHSLTQFLTIAIDRNEGDGVERRRAAEMLVRCLQRNQGGKGGFMMIFRQELRGPCAVDAQRLDLYNSLNRYRDHESRDLHPGAQ